jgi:hypothetical protein
MRGYGWLQGYEGEARGQGESEGKKREAFISLPMIVTYWQARWSEKFGCIGPSKDPTQAT